VDVGKLAEGGGMMKTELGEAVSSGTRTPEAEGGCISDTFLCGEGELDIGGEGYDGKICHGGDPPFARARSVVSISGRNSKGKWK
jgi:hypothetical protein